MEHEILTFEEFIDSIEEQNENENEKLIQFKKKKFVDFPNDSSGYLMNYKFKPISFDNCIFPELVLFGMNEYAEIELNDCEAGELRFHKYTAKGVVNIIDSKIFHLNFAEGSMQGGCNIKESVIESLKFGDIRINKGLEILSKTNNLINNLRINISKIDSIKIESVRIHEFILEGSHNSLISINNCLIDRLISSAIGIRSKFIIDNLQPFNKHKSVLNFAKCEVTHLEILNSNLNKYEELTFLDSEFKKLYFSNIKWKTKVQNNIYDCIREHRFLKNLMSEQGNKVDEILFLAYELDAYRQSLVFKKNISEKTILWFNRWTNFYRLNVGLPVLLFVIFGLVFFLSILCCEGESIVGNWGRFFLFINPIHSISFLDIKLSNFSLFLDFTSRLFLSYFIYQFIQAFRRHSLR
jgi:hypothetical protein